MFQGTPADSQAVLSKLRDKSIEVQRERTPAQDFILEGTGFFIREGDLVLAEEGTFRESPVRN